MGLLDSMLQSVLNNNTQTQGAAAGGLGGLMGMVASNPQILKAITGMLGNDGASGGLGGLMAKFQQAGMGDVIGSWVGSGQNQPISADQISDVLGSDAISGMSAKMGMDSSEVAGQLSSMLLGLVDKLTPNGHAPEGGLGNGSDLMGMLGALMR